MGFSHLPSPVVGRSPAGGAGRAAAGCPRRGLPMQTPAGCRARAGPGAAWHHCLPSTEILPSAPLPSGSLSLPFLTPWLCLLGTSSIRLFAQRGFRDSLRVHRLENTFGNAPFHAPSPAPVPSANPRAVLAEGSSRHISQHISQHTACPALQLGAVLDRAAARHDVSSTVVSLSPASLGASCALALALARPPCLRTFFYSTIPQGFLFNCFFFFFPFIFPFLHPLPSSAFVSFSCFSFPELLTPSCSPETARSVLSPLNHSPPSCLLSPPPHRSLLTANVWLCHPPLCPHSHPLSLSLCQPGAPHALQPPQ